MLLCYFLLAICAKKPTHGSCFIGNQWHAISKAINFIASYLAIIADPSSNQHSSEDVNESITSGRRPDSQTFHHAPVPVHSISTRTQKILCLRYGVSGTARKTVVAITVIIKINHRMTTLLGVSVANRKRSRSGHSVCPKKKRVSSRRTLPSM